MLNWLKITVILCSCLFSFVLQASGVPGSVSYFNVSKTQVYDGETVSFSWGKPSGYSGTVKYNFYITKPGDRRWRYKTLVSSTSLNRYMSIEGTHKFEVEACNTSGQCGAPVTRYVTVKNTFTCAG